MKHTKVTVQVRRDGSGGRTTFQPGLNWNAKTEAVFDAIDALRDALKECQELPHEEHYFADGKVAV